MPDKFNYGGQAIIEGVMIRGKTHVAVAVRRPNGQARTRCEPLSTLYTGKWRKIPLIRGIIVMMETMTLGMKALMFSANTALEDEEGEEEQEFSGLATSGLLAVSLTFAVGIFFIGPLFITRALDPYITSSILSNLTEGGIRLVVFLGYLYVMGLMPDMRRVYAYHGAEHMTIAAHEHASSLEVDEIRKYPKEHPRCGTAFLLIVMVVAILTFAFLGRPELWLRILSRLVLIPVIAAVSYEIIRFNARHEANRLAKAVTFPGLLLQKLTTRRPDDAQIAIAVSAMQTALRADGEVVPVTDLVLNEPVPGDEGALPEEAAVAGGASNDQDTTTESAVN
jgi:uncharacterized protein YqhQ